MDRRGFLQFFGAAAAVATAGGILLPPEKPQLAFTAADHRMMLHEFEKRFLAPVSFQPQTLAEFRAGIKPANVAYAPGDVRRYSHSELTR